MFRGCTILMVFAVLVARCGGDSPTPGMVFPDTAGTLGGDVPGIDAAGEDAPTNLDGSAPDAGSHDTGPEDSTAQDTHADSGPAPDCEINDDCTHLSNDPCTFWFCHPTQKTCKPATFPDYDPCDDGDICTVGDACAGGVCVSGEVISPPEAWDDPCNELVCDSLTGWHPAPVEGPCDDEDPCTGGGKCHAGVCVGGEDLCPESDCGDGHCQDLENCDTCPEDCGSCGSTCCHPHEGKGCGDPTCQDIVCGVDAFCCTSSWDELCAEQAQDVCGICD